MTLFERVGSHLPGIEKLRSLLRSGERPGMAEVLDVRLVEVEEGRVVFEATPGEEHFNPMGTVHGGYAATLLDFACGYTVTSRLRPYQTFSTLELKVSYQRPITAATGTVRAVGRTVTSGRRVAFVEAQLLDREEKVLATCSSTCLVLEMERPGTEPDRP